MTHSLVSRGKSSRRFQKLRKEFRALCRLENRPCWICGMEIDYRITDPHDDEVFELWANKALRGE